MNFATLADSAVNVMQSSVNGTGPAIVGIVGLILAVALVIKLLHKAGK